MCRYVFILALFLVLAACDGDGQGGRTLSEQEGSYTWMERATGLPNTLNAVAANTAKGIGFVAVGDGGTIMTSDDGLTWTKGVSPTSVDLNFVKCYDGNIGLTVPARCFAAGDAGTILASSSSRDDGETWTTWFDGPDDVSFHSFRFNTLLGGAAVGTVVTTDVARILYGHWYSEPWTLVEPLEQPGHYITDLARDDLGAEGAFVFQAIATVDVPFPEQAKVLVSNDMRTWVEVYVSDTHGSTYSIERYDDYWVSGSGGNMYKSADGINWTRHQTPALQSNLVAMSSAGSVLMAHGFNASIGMGEQVGVATSDDGETWQMFVIGAAYEPRGLAYSRRRWVSVGQSLAEPGKGAIFTTQ